VNFWFKNSNGKKDAMLTFATISFIVVTFSIALSSISEINIGDFRISFIPLEAGLASIYIGATFTAYVTRKYTDKKFEKDGQPTISTMVDDLMDTDLIAKEDKRKTRSTKSKTTQP